MRCGKDMQEATGKDLPDRVAHTIHAEIRYEPYLAREAKEAQKAHTYKGSVLPETFDYTQYARPF